jgi:hypothetical protein
MAIGSRGATTRCRIGTDDQAIRTFDQNTAAEAQPKTEKPRENPGSSIKKSERAIIPSGARTGKKDA